MRTVAFLCALIPIATCSLAQPAWQPPRASARLVAGIPIAAGTPVGQRFRNRFTECDQHDTCDGKPVTSDKCSTDRNENHALLRLPGGAIFFDAKLAIDNDGSPLSRLKHGTDSPDTSLRYEELPKRPSINADAVPYIVLPLGGFFGELHVELGDIAAVIYKDKLVYAIVGDEGPPCKIGEGSMQLHELLGNHVCRARNQAGNCTDVDETLGIDNDVLFFVFPDSARLILPGLTPANINARLKEFGPTLFNALKSPPH